MSSRTSNKSPASSIRSCGKLVTENKVDPAAKTGDASGRRPSTTWSVWNNRRESTSNVHPQKSEPTAHKPTNNIPSEEQSSSREIHMDQSWWRKPSFTSLRTVASKKDSSPDTALANSTSPEPPEELKDGRCTDKPNENNEEKNTGVIEIQEPRRRAWSFWNRNNHEGGEQEPKEVANSKNQNDKKFKPITNELILTDHDAILFQTKSEQETANQRDLTGENEAHGHKSNILVPHFEILPEYTTLTSIYSQMGKLGHRWNLVSDKRFKQHSLYRRDPRVSTNSLSRGSSEPIRVLLVGVHGFFPTKMIRPLIGEPTGTSTKFITEAEKAVIRWFHKLDTPVEIKKIALEKEGKIFDRVAFFFEVMKKWSDEINKADFVYFVAHSQGCPVTIILLAKLIEAGVIDLDMVSTDPEAPSALATTRKKKIISVLAMAGVNNGPFYGVDQTLFVRAYSTIEDNSLKELFQFQNFNSLQSKKLVQSLRIIIGSNIKITFVGSINDQLVPLYSSTCLFAQHPNIFRATFIDQDSRTPEFITRIVSIANNLNNLGLDDHGIIKEISASLAGTLTCGGHSRIYNEGQVYDLGIKFALETTDIAVDTPVIYKPYQVDQLGSNPYHLPWCMRGLLFETSVQLGKEQIHALFKEFEEWEPETKQLKDVKYRLNGLKSKL